MNFYNKNNNIRKSTALGRALFNRDDENPHIQPVVADNQQSGGLFGGDNDTDIGESLKNIGSTAASFLPYGGIASGAVDGIGSFAEHGDYKDGLQGLFGINKEGSDVKQGINGTLNGLKMGAPFGPIGMAIGAGLGLGASFLDDI